MPSFHLESHYHCSISIYELWISILRLPTYQSLPVSTALRIQYSPLGLLSSFWEWPLDSASQASYFKGPNGICSINIICTYPPPPLTLPKLIGIGSIGIVLLLSTGAMIHTCCSLVNEWGRHSTSRYHSVCTDTCQTMHARAWAHARPLLAMVPVPTLVCCSLLLA
jgi:hypothetical protein